MKRHHGHIEVVEKGRRGDTTTRIAIVLYNALRGVKHVKRAMRHPPKQAGPSMGRTPGDRTAPLSYKSKRRGPESCMMLSLLLPPRTTVLKVEGLEACMIVV
mmetsp:Transcript_36254/g.54705  ORF Transcript_36254/g.54705 Transcript_36254/m.54705 type:complete len:102 (+) Transcript_36254:413-718(+)